jgi:hypothetical protein
VHTAANFNVGCYWSHGRQFGVNIWEGAKLISSEEAPKFTEREMQTTLMGHWPPATLPGSTPVTELSFLEVVCTASN